jgi:hypothetical protein
MNDDTRWALRAVQQQLTFSAGFLTASAQRMRMLNTEAGNGCAIGYDGALDHLKVIQDRLDDLTKVLGEST